MTTEIVRTNAAKCAVYGDIEPCDIVPTAKTWSDVEAEPRVDTSDLEPCEIVPTAKTWSDVEREQTRRHAAQHRVTPIVGRVRARRRGCVVRCRREHRRRSARTATDDDGPGEPAGLCSRQFAWEAA